jgi:hypothetical protein
VCPALAVDPTNGKLYASWSDAHHVFFSASSDQGSHWSPAAVVNVAPATQSNAGGSTWYANVKATQGLAKDAFDAINNQVAFAP